MMNKDLKSRISKIIDIIEDIPEKYQEIAFTELLRKELSKEVLMTSSKSTVKEVREKSSKPRLKSEYQDWEEEVMSGLPEPHIVAENGSRDQQAVWAVAILYFRGEDATTDNVRAVIRDELGLTPQNNSNTARTLRNLVPKYLRREKEGKTYRYEPNRNSIKIFANEGN